LALVDTVTTDLVLSARGELTRYNGQYEVLRKAALPPAESCAFLIEAADQLDDGTESPA
jgi:hypothetical protein